MDASTLSDSDLRTALIEHNVYASPPPIGATTRHLLKRKLQMAFDEMDQGGARLSRESVSPAKTSRKSASMTPTKASASTKAREETPFDDADDYAGEESFEAGDGSPLYPKLPASPYMRALYSRREDIGVMTTPNGGKAYVSPMKPRKNWNGNFTGRARTIVIGMFFVFIAMSLYMFAGRFVDEFAPDWHAFIAPFQAVDEIE